MTRSPATAHRVPDPAKTLTRWRRHVPGCNVRGRPADDDQNDPTNCANYSVAPGSVKQRHPKPATLGGPRRRGPRHAAGGAFARKVVVEGWRRRGPGEYRRSGRRSTPSAGGHGQLRHIPARGATAAQPDVSGRAEGGAARCSRGTHTPRGSVGNRAEPVAMGDCHRFPTEEFESGCWRNRSK
jgi:hypothetical protein